jgi:hypothetical protein
VQPVYFDTALIRPLPKELLGSVCSVCDKPQSVWALPFAAQQGTEIPFVCSLCVLYKSRWAESGREAVDALIAAVEARKSAQYERTLTGELVQCSDADRFLMAIFLENRLAATKRAEKT